MLNQDICYLYDSIAVYSSYGGIVFAEEEGRNIAKALGPKNKVATPFLSISHFRELLTNPHRSPSFSTSTSNACSCCLTTSSHDSYFYF
jgi:hypothetical protein